MDAGAAGRLLTEHLLDAFEHTTVARFNTDRLLDYRSRRPLMTFDDGKWETLRRPRAVGLQARRTPTGSRSCCSPARSRTTSGRPFVARRAGRSPSGSDAGPMITYFGVPMGIPHTRPLGVITHATRPGLVTPEGAAAVASCRSPRRASALMEYRFGEAGRDAIGLVVQVPHYLSQAAYPTAALTLHRRADRGHRARPARARAARGGRPDQHADRPPGRRVVRGRRAGPGPRGAVRRGARATTGRTCSPRARRCRPRTSSPRSSSSSSPSSRAVGGLARTADSGRLTRSPGRAGALFIRW